MVTWPAERSPLTTIVRATRRVRASMTDSEPSPMLEVTTQRPSGLTSTRIGTAPVRTSASRASVRAS